MGEITIPAGEIIYIMSGEAYASQSRAVFWPRLCPFVFYNYGSFMSFRPRARAPGGLLCQLVIAQVSSLRVRTVGLSVCDSPTFAAPYVHARTRAIHAPRIYARINRADRARGNVKSAVRISRGARGAGIFAPLALAV